MNMRLFNDRRLRLELYKDKEIELECMITECLLLLTSRGYISTGNHMVSRAMWY